jgi:uncharacterized protein YbjT (DUF2867 family)
MANSLRILVTGTTGYVGGRLVPRLLDEGYQVRILTRDVSRLQGRKWINQVDVVQGDIVEESIVKQALSGMDVAYYLIYQRHELNEEDRPDFKAAKYLGEAAKENGVKRIIHLSGLGDPVSKSQNQHLGMSIGDALGESGVPVTEFRATVIVGCGSTFFEMVRYLTERLPLTLLPQWSYTHIQPIATFDVLAYLVAALNNPQSQGKTIEIYGPEVLSMSDMMRIYAEVRGLHRWMIPVPALPPLVSSYWIHWITPVPARIAHPMIEDLRHEVPLSSDLAQNLFPDIHPSTFADAVRFSMERLDAGLVETSWTDALSTTMEVGQPVILTHQEGMIYEQRQRLVEAPPENVFRIISRLGGEEGWLYLNWLWQLRGILDRVFGGGGLQRGRRDPQDLRVGDAVDFWRVESFEQNRLIRFRAEMNLPGLAWLQFETKPLQETKTDLRLTAFFAPKGFSGWLYWYFYYPFHKLIFPGLIRKIAEKAENNLEVEPSVTSPTHDTPAT